MVILHIDESIDKPAKLNDIDHDILITDVGKHAGVRAGG
jgi:hypothetical protein